MFPSAHIRQSLLLVLVVGCLFLFATAAQAQEALTDSLGDPLPKGAVARLGTVRLRHGARISCMAVFPDGKKMVSACRENPLEQHNMLVIWDAATGKELRQVGPQVAVEHVAISPDGKKIASGGITLVCVWDAKSGKKLHDFFGGDGEYFRALAFSPDGKHLAVGGIGIHWWDLENGKGKVWVTQPAPQGGLNSLSFTPEGKMLASGGHDEIILWEVATGKERARLKAGPDHFGHAFALGFLPDNRLVSGGQDGIVWLWDPVRKKPRKIIGKHHHPSSYYGDWLRSLALSPDGKTVASAGDSSGIRLWDVQGQKQFGLIDPQDSCFSQVAFMDKGKTVVSALDTIRFWDTATGKEKRPLPGHHLAVRSLSFAPNGKTLASASLDGSIRFWNLQKYQQQEPTIAAGPNDIIGGFSNVVHSPDGKTVATTTSGFQPTIHLWDAATGKLLQKFNWPDYQATCVAFSPDGRYLVGGMEDFRIRMWEAATGKKVWEVSVGKAATITSLAFSPDGKQLVNGSYENVVIVRDAATGKETRRFGGLPPTEIGDHIKIEDVAFSPDGTLVAGTCTNNKIYLWDFTSGKEQRQFSDFESYGYSTIAFSPDGKLLASGGRGQTIYLWEVATGNLRKVFTGHRNKITDLAFAPDGRTLASASADTTILLWEVK